jgi:hypothetical protein
VQGFHAVRGQAQGVETARYRKSINVASSFQPSTNPPTASRKAYQPVGKQCYLVMHDTPHGAAAARAHSSNTAPATLLLLYERFTSSKVCDAVFNSAHAMPQGETNLAAPARQSVGRPAKLQTQGHSLDELSPGQGEVRGCFAQRLA